MTSPLLRTLAGATFALTASSAFAAHVAIQSVLFDHDQDVSTVGPAAPDPMGGDVSNGDFTIYRLPSAADATVGNGIDDRTRGTFDFRADPNYADFVNTFWAYHDLGVTLDATLVLRLAIGNPLYVNDQVSLEDSPFFGDPSIGSQLSDPATIVDPSNPDLHEVTINLGDYFARDHLAALLGSGSGIGTFFDDGRVTMVYGDDATVTGAYLRFFVNAPDTVPEPASLVLAGCALALMAVFTRRRPGSV